MTICMQDKIKNHRGTIHTIVDTHKVERRNPGENHKYRISFLQYGCCVLMIYMCEETGSDGIER